MPRKELTEMVEEVYRDLTNFYKETEDAEFSPIRGKKAEVSNKYLKKLYYDKNKHIYTGKPFCINNLFIRHYDPEIDQFNDLLFTSLRTVDEQFLFPARVNTLPSLKFLLNKIGKDAQGKKATAILKPGQYDYREGWHFGYRAAVQASPVVVYRDINYDHKFDFTNEHRGWFGINVHKSDKDGKSLGSAGCLTFKRDVAFYNWRKLFEINNAAKGKNGFKITLVSHG